MTDDVLELRRIRYNKFIAPMLGEYTRRFSVLDVGAGVDGFNGLETARRFDAAVVMIEQDPQFTVEPGSSVCVLKRHFTVEDLERLSTCEHFDVVLALNILHHFGSEWERAASAILNFGDVVLFQTPDPNTGACGEEWLLAIKLWLEGHGYYVGCSTQYPRHAPRPVYRWDRTNPKTLTDTNVDSPRDCAQVVVEAWGHTKRAANLHKGMFIDWHEGMNLWNWRRMGGWHPPLPEVLQKLRDFPLPERNHGDLVPWNFIFDGRDLFLIDGFEGWEFDDRENLKQTVRWMEAGERCS